MAKGTICPLQNLGKKLERKHTRRDLFQYTNCKLKQKFYHTFKVHSKVTFQSCSLNTYVSCSTKRGERTWQSLIITCHIENMFENQKAFSLQIEARVNQRKMIQKKNSVLIRKKRMRIEGNRKNHKLSRKLGCEITHTLGARDFSCAVSAFGQVL